MNQDPSSAEHRLVALLAGSPVSRSFDSWSAFLAAGLPAIGFCALAWAPAERDALIAEIRQSGYWDRPVFCGKDEALSPLVDGAMLETEAHAAAERMDALRASLRLQPESLQREERLLYFLYLREGAELQPQLDRLAPLLYRYPVAEALAQAGDHVDAWLTSFVRRGLLEPVTVIDRTRHCRQCASAHLHYLDVCPHCNSLQIRKAASLHCFTCGHVAPEADFHDEHGLGCPKCRAKLRHIGVDYDRPLTQFACAACHHAFVEANIVVRCLDCGAVAEPSELDVREVASLSLTPHGRAVLRAGQIEESFAALDLPNSVVPNYFRRLLDWALVTQQRHAELKFGLILIEFEDAAGLVESLGAPRAFLLLDEFARRLHELLRGSDVTTRTSESRLWLFLPFSSTQGFVARLHRVLEEQPQAEAFKLRIRSLEAPGELAQGDSAQLLMQRLEASA